MNLGLKMISMKMMAGVKMVETMKNGQTVEMKELLKLK